MVEMITAASLPAASEVQAKYPAAAVAVVLVALGGAPVAERFVEAVGGGLVGAAPEGDRLGAELPRPLVESFDQGPRDPLAARPPGHRKARELRLAGAGDGTARRAGREERRDRDHL